MESSRAAKILINLTIWLVRAHMMEDMLEGTRSLLENLQVVIASRTCCDTAKVSVAIESRSLHVFICSSQHIDVGRESPSFKPEATVKAAVIQSARSNDALQHHMEYMI
jgi:hypothetical protein